MSLLPTCCSCHLRTKYKIKTIQCKLHHPIIRQKIFRLFNFYRFPMYDNLKHPIIHQKIFRLFNFYCCPMYDNLKHPIIGQKNISLVSFLSLPNVRYACINKQRPLQCTAYMHSRLSKCFCLVTATRLNDAKIKQMKYFASKNFLIYSICQDRGEVLG